jgi:hypothetical protein
MSDPRNVAHAKKVAEEKKHHGADITSEDGHAVQPGKKPAAARKKHDPAGAAALSAESGTAEAGAPSDSPAPTPRSAATLEGSLAVLTKLKEMESHSRATLERLAQLGLTVEDELKQKELAGQLGEVYSAQTAFETKLTAFIESYQAECDRLHGEGG